MSDERLQWRTEKRKISDLVEFEGNPRKMSNKQRAELQRSLERFDLVEIPAIDVDDTILAGHQRLRGMVALGRGDEIVDVRVPNRGLTEEERKEYLLRSNKNVGEWDEEKLVLFDETTLLEAGFTNADLNGLLSNDEQDAQEEEFEIPEMQNRAFENHDYLVLKFDRTEDWIRAQEIFGIEQVNTSWVAGKRKIGLGRVVDGAALFEIADHQPGPREIGHDESAGAVGDDARPRKRKG
jgi:hypothetical protein